MPRILVVEDDTDIAELIAHYLTGAGHTVERLTSGRDVLPRLRREPVDLVILDIMLPGLDGLRICDAMRADPATAAIPVIMLTARGEKPTYLRSRTGRATTLTAVQPKAHGAGQRAAAPADASPPPPRAGGPITIDPDRHQVTPTAGFRLTAGISAAAYLQHRGRTSRVSC